MVNQPVADIDDVSSPYTDCDDCNSTNGITGAVKHWIVWYCGSDTLHSIADRSGTVSAVGDFVTVSVVNQTPDEFCGKVIGDDGTYDDGIGTSELWYSDISDASWTDCDDCEAG